MAGQGRQRPVPGQVHHQTRPGIAIQLGHGLLGKAGSDRQPRPHQHQPGMVGNARVGLGQQTGGTGQVVRIGGSDALGAQATEGGDV